MNELVIWIGPLAAIAAVGFAIYKWRKPGPVRFTVKSSRVVSGLLEVTWMNTRIEIYNVGKETTVIQDVSIIDIGTKPERLWSDVYDNDNQLPYKLVPGDFWQGYADTDITELLVSSISKTVVVSIKYSHSNKPYQTQFRPERKY